MPATGGTATPARRFEAEPANLMHVFPAFLDDGRHFLFVEQSPNGSRRSIQLASLDEPAATRLLGVDEADSGNVVSQGHLLYARNRTFSSSTGPH